MFVFFKGGSGLFGGAARFPCKGVLVSLQKVLVSLWRMLDFCSWGGPCLSAECACFLGGEIIVFSAPKDPNKVLINGVGEVGTERGWARLHQLAT